MARPAEELAGIVHAHDYARLRDMARNRDAGELAELLLTRGREDWLRRQLPEGEWRVISGVVEHFNNEIQITHPDHMVPPDQQAAVMSVEPVYPLTAGLSSRLVTPDELFHPGARESFKI